MCIRDSHSTEAKGMAASGAAETFGFNENLGPRPNSAADSLITT